MICIVCKGTDFYDDAQGSKICALCGTATQEYLQESYDLEDEIIPSQGKLQYRNIITGVGKGGASRKRQLPNESSNMKLVDILQAYQYILIKMMQAILNLYHIDEEYDIQYVMNDLQSLWMKYLHRLRDEGNIQVMNYFHQYQTHDHISSTIYPSLYLLVSMVYYICRYYRFGIDPAMICRWCEQGLLPIHNPWDILPENIKNNIPTQYQIFFSRYYLSNDLTPITLITYYSRFASFIGIDTLPPLNAPLIAWKYIEALGLPVEVWLNYIQISKTMSPDEPIDGFQSYGEDYGENIMALIIIACKLCRNWMNFFGKQFHGRLLRKISRIYDQNHILGMPSRSSRDAVRKQSKLPHRLPLSLAELDHIPREQLSSLLQQMEGLLPKRSFETEAHAYNRHIRRMMTIIPENDLEALKDPSMSSKAICTTVNTSTALNQTIESYSSSISLNASMIHADYPYINPKTTKKSPWKKYYRNLHGIANPVILRGKKRKSLSQRRRIFRQKILAKIKKENNKDGIPPPEPGILKLLSYSNFAYDHLGIYHPIYVLLVERCAKLIYTSPHLLHHLVDQVFEPKIHNIVKGKSPETKAASIDSIQPYNLHHQLFETVTSAQSMAGSNEGDGRKGIRTSDVETVDRYRKVTSKRIYEWNQQRLDSHINLTLLSEIGLMPEFNEHEPDEYGDKKVPAFTDEIYQPQNTAVTVEDIDIENHWEDYRSSETDSDDDDGEIIVEENQASLFNTEEPFREIFDTIRRRRLRSQPNIPLLTSMESDSFENTLSSEKGNELLGNWKTSAGPTSHRLRQYLQNR